MDTHKLLIDDFEHTSPGAEAPDVRGLVGILVRQPVLKTMEVLREQAIVAQLKLNGIDADFSGCIHPLKNSMGEDGKVVQYYCRYGSKQIYDRLKHPAWKREMLHDALTICEDVTVFIAVVTSYSNRKEFITKQYKDEGYAYCLDNLLKKVGSHIKANKIRANVQVVCDRVPADMGNKFDQVYTDSWLNNGINHISNYCGPLRLLGFEPSILFAQTIYTPGLQFADILAGQIREFTKEALHNEPGRGVETMRILFSQKNLVTDNFNEALKKTISVSPSLEKDKKLRLAEKMSRVMQVEQFRSAD